MFGRNFRKPTESDRLIVRVVRSYEMCDFPSHLIRPFTANTLKPRLGVRVRSNSKLLRASRARCEGYFAQMAVKMLSGGTISAPNLLWHRCKQIGRLSWSLWSRRGMRIWRFSWSPLRVILSASKRTPQALVAKMSTGAPRFRQRWRVTSNVWHEASVAEPSVTVSGTKVVRISLIIWVTLFRLLQRDRTKPAAKVDTNFESARKIEVFCTSGVCFCRRVSEINRPLPAFVPFFDMRRNKLNL